MSQKFPKQHYAEHCVPQSIPLFECCTVNLSHFLFQNPDVQLQWIFEQSSAAVASLCSRENTATPSLIIWLFVSCESLFLLLRLIGRHPHGYLRHMCEQLAFCKVNATDSQQTGFLTLIFSVSAPPAGGHREGAWLMVGGSRGNSRCHGGGRKWCAGSWATLARRLSPVRTRWGATFNVQMQLTQLIKVFFRKRVLVLILFIKTKITRILPQKEKHFCAFCL